MNTEDIVERTGIAREAHGATMKGPLLIIPGVLGMFYSVGTKSNIPNFGSSARSRPRAPLIVRLLLNHVSVSSSSLRCWQRHPGNKANHDEEFNRHAVSSSFYQVCRLFIAG